jgi:cytidylate kinase
MSKRIDLSKYTFTQESPSATLKSYKYELDKEQKLKPAKSNFKVKIDGTEITSDIRTARIDKSVSKVSSVPGVRAALVAQQQRMGAEGSYVVEGRDIGTVVFPKAELKIFLTASAEERARRRVAQNLERGVGSTNYEEVLADIVKRDELDSSRETSPLKPAEDAVLVDSTDASIDQIIARICDLARSRM